MGGLCTLAVGQDGEGVGGSVNSTARTQPSPPAALRRPSSSSRKLRTRKQPSEAAQPPTGSSTEPRRTRCTSPQVAFREPNRRSVSSTARGNTRAASSGAASPRGVSTGAAADQGSAKGSASPTAAMYVPHHSSKRTAPRLAKLSSTAFNAQLELARRVAGDNPHLLLRDPVAQ